MPKATPLVADQPAVPPPSQEPISRADMAGWSKPPRITVTTPGAPPEPASGVLRIRETVVEETVDRTVAPRRCVFAHGRDHFAGIAVRLPAGRARQLEACGDVLPAPGPRDAA